MLIIKTKFEACFGVKLIKYLLLVVDDCCAVLEPRQRVPAWEFQNSRLSRLSLAVALVHCGPAFSKTFSASSGLHYE